MRRSANRQKNFNNEIIAKMKLQAVSHSALSRRGLSGKKPNAAKIDIGTPIAKYESQWMNSRGNSIKESRNRVGSIELRGIGH
jgi:hypothetical protein